MPTFSYVAQDQNGKRQKGELGAADEQELHVRLLESGLYLISADPIEEVYRGHPIKARELADFNRQIGQLVASGVSLVRALNIISQQEAIKQHEREAYVELFRKVRQGIPMSVAMQEMGNTFPELLINMYRSAEVSGNLDKVAMRMASHYDKEWRLNSKVRNATLYPKILGVLIVIVVTILMAYVLPQFKDLFDQMESLPLPTEMLMALSDFISAHWLAIIICIVVAIFAFNAALKVPKVRLYFDKLKLHLPVIGKLYRVICTARFARTISSLYTSGLPLVSGLEIARHTTGNTYIDSQFDPVITAVRSGANLSDSLAMIDGFINKLEFAVRVGEETGSLDAMLESTADALDYESEMALQRMVGYLEPLLIVVMAIIVGFVMIAVIVPIYNSYQTIGQNS